MEQFLGQFNSVQLTQLCSHQPTHWQGKSDKQQRCTCIVTLRKHCSATAKPLLWHQHRSGHKSKTAPCELPGRKTPSQPKSVQYARKKISVLPDLVSAATAYVTTHGAANRLKSRLLIWSSGPLNISVTSARLCSNCTKASTSQVKRQDPPLKRE